MVTEATQAEKAQGGQARRGQPRRGQIVTLTIAPPHAGQPAEHQEGAIQLFCGELPFPTGRRFHAATEIMDKKRLPVHFLGT